MRFAAALLCASLIVAPALAQQPGQTVAISDADAAQLLIANGRLDDAKKVLTHILDGKPDDSESLFLLGTIAVAQVDYDTAISLFRRLLVKEPDAERVRLELARAFFLKADYQNADRQFRFARAGDIPDAAKENIDHFLGAISRLREWTFDFALGLAPDTNQNAATSASQVQIFGLPFTLDPNARSQSGVGLAGAASGEWSPLVSDTVKARVGANVSRVEYSGGNFDDMTISGYAGPQFLFPDWDVSLLATGFQRWYANKSFVSGVGGKLAGEYGITSDLLAGGSVGVQAVTDRFTPEQSGALTTTQAQAAYVLSPSSLVQLQIGFNRQDARIAAYSYSGIWTSLAYQRDLPFGFSASVQPAWFVTRYDEALPAFGRKRADDALMLNVSLLNRRFEYHGFTPRFSYTFTDQHSNLALYSYTRHQFQIGLTSQF
ncbi:MAG: surface lipoprotein assembly modifier [Pseudomonadota bacterium]